MPPPVPPYVIDLSIGDQPDTAIDLETYEEQELVARKEVSHVSTQKTELDTKRVVSRI